MGIILRDYQKEAIDRINEMNVGEKKICAIPTGGGKTIIFSEISKTVKGRVLIVVDQSELRTQTIDKLLMVGVDECLIGSVQGKFDEVDAKIVICTRQSLTHGKSNRINRILEHGEFELIIFDEVHRAVGQVKKIVDRVGKESKVVGFTATPYNLQLKQVFNGFVYEKNILELINDKYLCSPRCFRINSDTDLSNIRTVGGEFVQSQLAEVVNNDDRNQIIVRAYLSKASNIKSTIVFATSIEHSEDIAECFRVNGVNAKSHSLISIKSIFDLDDDETIEERKKIKKKKKN